MTPTHVTVALAASLLATTALAQVPAPDSHALALKYRAFDPLEGEPAVPALLAGGADTNLWIVQFRSAPGEDDRTAVAQAGGVVQHYLPHDAYVVRMPVAAAAELWSSARVRWVGFYHPAYRIEPFVRAELADGTTPRRIYNVVVADKHGDKPALAAKVGTVGGEVVDEMAGSILMRIGLDQAQLLAIARQDEVLWIDRYSAPEFDMNNARIQGGANYIEPLGNGYTGKGIIGHQFEGLEAGHQDFTNRPIAYPGGCGSADTHGHCTAGIVYGNGTSTPGARGMVPDAQAYYSHSSCATNRYQVLGALVATNNIMFTTASWGGARTTAYTSTSAEADDICFDHDLVWSNSQSNASTQASRPEAWAKNVVSGGGVAHRDNSNPLDDSWAAGGASIGPAADGRIKPTLCAYYDAILTSDLTGGAGYSSGNFYTGFGGTSGATPIIAGHNGLAIQLFTDGVFGNTLRNPGGSRFSNKPHFPTLKALQVANAAQYAFQVNDNRRQHQGWGFPDLKSMWDNRNVHYIVDEEDVLRQGDTMRHIVTVPAGRSALKIAMSFAEPAGNPAASIAAVNDLSLQVVSPSGTVYFGNEGLWQGVWSTPGGKFNTVDTVECVFIQNPAPGDWRVEVHATLIAMDSHVETPVVDADYGLVVNGGTFKSKKNIAAGQYDVFGNGCVGSKPKGDVCTQFNANTAATPMATAANTAYAIEVTYPFWGLVVAGFDIWADSPSGPQTLPIAVHLADAQGRPGPAVATGGVKIGATPGWYTGLLSTSVQVNVNQKFFVSYQNGASPIRHHVVAGGTVLPHFTQQGGTWSARQTTDAWTLRVRCVFGRLTPAMASTEVPEIGKPFHVDLTDAVPNSAAALLTGLSNTSWGGRSLPFDLGAFGAQNCLLLVSPDLSLTVNTDTAGNATATIPVPADQSLIGLTLFQQFLVVDPTANSLGVAVTNGARLLIGG